ncbi:Citrate synthase 2 [Caulifigura coniformis]|uniref:citrate synthase (unknown stereospecificity) n=1 Tax=Caulifigura coniformis TaxID=2527983 RepID=A0A517S9P1_9PLAN|nr:citrate/2-methylcitrate synthase [Caulifigura coniformis]QDT52847.1 Citrate synthase 2 [Caulifigura coniformis]
MATEFYHPGLRGVIAGETDICSLDDGLRYRGYCIYDLVQGASFFEVAYLLLYEQLPNEERFADFISVLADEAELADGIPELLELLPLHISPLEALRTGINLLSHGDPQSGEAVGEAGQAQAIRMLARVPLLLSTICSQRYPGWEGETAENKKEYRRFDPSLSFSCNLFRLLQGRSPLELEEHALEVALILAIEHEFTPSSFSARLAGSTHADIYSAIQAALSTFIGARHSGADRSVLEVLDAIPGQEDAEEWVRARQEAGDRIAGFGHPVFTESDPRAALLESYCQRIAQLRKQASREELAGVIEDTVWAQMRLPSNFDWPFGRLLEYLGFRRDLHPAIFVCSRLVGWCAHAMEQSSSGEAIRPRARYRGAEHLEFEPIWRRDA